MANVLLVTDVWDDGQRLHVVGTINLSGNYTQVTGEPLSLAVDKVYSDKVPVQLEVSGRGCGAVVTYTPGATRDAGKLRLWGAAGGAGGLTEIATAAYNAAITGDTFDFHAIFKKL